MGLFGGMNISASGMTAQRLRMDLISNNIANINTTRTEDGGPYKKKSPVFKAKGQAKFSLPDVASNKGQMGQGVEVTSIKESNKPPRLVYNPNHPDANQEGYVKMPNIDIASEMVNMISASRAYEANVTALNASKKMFKSALKIEG
ncbi:flagellar basal body rod protein FlgC [Selenihalanaerobacter shriftii]|uniref:Flagellar basal-body rod protein FlgC n=1 Tax=Selenihalanaerobacter shriftii TaxID=142842 RepID=A0A1T4MAS5_9FIRM|nr:flagellar basal body rod protein FlgC [Selenihalanaerobacter shriftii]SJZ64015.1 flagellar basal-body rod protein FlgC [Selenihalanaerobacter shriftii]